MLILTHPNNSKYVMDMCRFDQVRREVSKEPRVFLNEIQVRFDDCIPEREIEYVWEPPEDRFVEYEKSDEEWMRPLGMGTIRSEDVGPFFYIVDEQQFKTIFDYMPCCLTNNFIRTKGI